jgi:hypothetical protein
VLCDALLMAIAADARRDVIVQRLARETIYLKTRTLLEFLTMPRQTKVISISHFKHPRRTLDGQWARYYGFIHDRSLHIGKERLQTELSSVKDVAGHHLRSFAATVIDETYRFIEGAQANDVHLSAERHVGYLVELNERYHTLAAHAIPRVAGLSMS